MKTAAITTMMAGLRTVGLGCFSPVQQLDKQRKASKKKRRSCSYLLVLRSEDIVVSSRTSA
jgi:hypothetical protein